MGVWGVRLYSSDFAQDLRTSVAAVVHLPFKPDRLVELLCATESSAATDPKDSDHTVFWLTIADQFAKRGIDCPRARDRALAIIDDAADLAMMESLGMDGKSLAKRRAMLDELRVRIAAPVGPAKPRSVLKSPQKLILDPGDVVVYPTCKGDAIDPYAVGKDFAWVKAWKQDGWGALAVAERGHVFEFLAWYRPLVICETLPTEPDLVKLQEPRMWLLRSPGTLTARHFTNMQMKTVGHISVDSTKLDQFFPKRGSAVYCAVSDISLGNNIHVRSLAVYDTLRPKDRHRPTPRINALSDIANVTI